MLYRILHTIIYVTATKRSLWHQAVPCGLDKLFFKSQTVLINLVLPQAAAQLGFHFYWKNSNAASPQSRNLFKNTPALNGFLQGVGAKLTSNRTQVSWVRSANCAMTSPCNDFLFATRLVSALRRDETSMNSSPESKKTKRSCKKPYVRNFKR